MTAPLAGLFFAPLSVAGGELLGIVDREPRGRGQLPGPRNLRGVDELVFLDITASSDERRTMVDVVSRTAERCFMPLTVGGGIRTVADMRQMLLAGADKVSVNTAAVFNPGVVDEAAAASGLGPRWADVQADWAAEVGEVLAEAGLKTPAVTAFRSTGKQGVHTEHMGFILAEMQQLQRAFPGGAW